MTTDTDRDFETLAKMNVPVKRAAYSDRTAWTMAILAELAYSPFDEESNDHILELAAELAKLADKDKIAERLTALQKVLAGLNPAPADQADTNTKLRACRVQADSGFPWRPFCDSLCLIADIGVRYGQATSTRVASAGCCVC